MRAKAFFFAYEIEAAGVIEAFGYKPIAKEPYMLYENARGNLLFLSGIGNLNAANCLWYACKNYDFAEAFNIGAAGALKSGMKLGELYCATQVASLDPFYKGVFRLEKADESLPEARLITAHEPVKLESERLKCARLADLVDMEGCAFAAAAAHNNKPLKIVKFVSDFSEGCDIPSNIIKLRGVLNGYKSIF